MDIGREDKLVCTSGVHGILAASMFLGCNWIPQGDGMMPADHPNALGHLGCQNKIPQAEWLKHHKFVSSHCLEASSPINPVGRVDFF